MLKTIKRIDIELLEDIRRFDEDHIIKQIVLEGCDGRIKSYNVEVFENGNV